MFSQATDNIPMNDTEKYKSSCAFIETTFLERVEALETAALFEIKIEKLFFNDFIKECLNQKLLVIKNEISTYFAKYCFDPLLPSIDLVRITNVVNGLIDAFLEFKNRIIKNARALTKLLANHLPARDIDKTCKSLVDMDCLKSVLLEDKNPTHILFDIERKKLLVLKEKILNDYSPDLYRRNYIINKINQTLLKIYVYGIKLGIEWNNKINFDAELKLLKLIKDISSSRKQLGSIKIELYIKDKFKDLDLILLKDKYFNLRAEHVFAELMQTLNRFSDIKQYSDERRPNIFHQIYLNHKEYVPKKLSIFSNSSKPSTSQTSGSTLYTVKL